MIVTDNMKATRKSINLLRKRWRIGQGAPTSDVQTPTTRYWSSQENTIHEIAHAILLNLEDARSNTIDVWSKNEDEIDAIAVELILLPRLFDAEKHEIETWLAELINVRRTSFRRAWKLVKKNARTKRIRVVADRIEEMVRTVQ